MEVAGGSSEFGLVGVFVLGAIFANLCYQRLTWKKRLEVMTRAERDQQRRFVERLLWSSCCIAGGALILLSFMYYGTFAVAVVVNVLYLVFGMGTILQLFSFRRDLMQAGQPGGQPTPTSE